MAAAHNNLANALHDQQDLDGAIAQYREALRLSPGDAQVRGNLDNTLLERSHLDSANSQPGMLIVNAEDAVAHYDRGNELWRKQDLDGAIANFRQVVRISPDYAAGHFTLANALYAKQDYSGAIAQYRETLRIMPKSALGAL
ncbi:MAG: tetratricopeptide repeat protein [Steroidobacteraceae bacterium]